MDTQHCMVYLCVSLNEHVQVNVFYTAACIEATDISLLSEVMKCLFKIDSSESPISRGDTFSTIDFDLPCLDHSEDP